MLLRHNSNKVMTWLTSNSQLSKTLGFCSNLALIIVNALSTGMEVNKAETSYEKLRARGNFKVLDFLHKVYTVHYVVFSLSC